MRCKSQADIAIDAKLFASRNDVNDNDDNDDERNYKPGQIVFPPANYNLFKPYYVPNSLARKQKHSENDNDMSSSSKQLGDDSGTLVSLGHSLIGGFKESVVQSEYYRFLHRDIKNLVLGLPDIGGCIIYPAIGIPRESTLLNPIQYAMTGVMIIVIGLEIFIHFAVPVHFSANQVLARRVLAGLIGVSCVCLLSFLSPTLYARCDLSVDYLREWGIQPGRAPMPQLNTTRHQRECIDVIEPYSVMTTVFLLPLLAMSPVSVAIVLITLQVGLTISGYFFPTVPERPQGSSFASVLVVQILCWIYGVVHRLVREQTLVSQFRGTVAARRSTVEFRHQSELTNTLIQSIVPPSVLRRQLNNERIEDRGAGTIFFSDQVQFTSWSSRRSVAEMMTTLSLIVRMADGKAIEHSVDKIRTVGDAWIGCAGLLTKMQPEEHARCVVRFALTFQSGVAEISSELVRKKQRQQQRAGAASAAGIKTENEIWFRCGVHTTTASAGDDGDDKNGGRLFGSVLGTTALRYEIFGDACEIAEHIEKHNDMPGSVQVSGTTERLLAGMDEFEMERRLQFTMTSTFSGAAYNVDVYRVTSACTTTPGREPFAGLRGEYPRQRCRSGVGTAASDQQEQSHDAGSEATTSVESVINIEAERAAAALIVKREIEQRALRRRFIEQQKQRKLADEKKRRAARRGISHYDNHDDDDDDNKDHQSQPKHLQQQEQQQQQQPQNDKHNIEHNSVDINDEKQVMKRFEEDVSRRACDWVFQHFASEAVEQEFQIWAAIELRSSRLVCRAAAVLFSTAILVCFAFQGVTHGALDAALLAAGFILNALSLTVTSSVLPPASANNNNENNNDDDSMLFFQTRAGSSTSWWLWDGLSAFCLLAGASLFTIGTALAPSATVSNDAIYVSQFYAITVAASIQNVSPAARGTIFVGSSVLPTLIVQWSAAMMPANVLYSMLASLLVFLMLFFDERQQRRTFVEKRLELEYQRRAAEAASEQKLILETVVPRHVIPALMAVGMDPTRLQPREHKKVAVGFVQFLRETGAAVSRHDALAMMATAHRELDAVLLELAVASSSASSSPLASSPSALSSPDTASPTTTTTPLSPQLDPNAAPLLIKIKTMGEYVLIAGPFDDGNDKREGGKVSNDGGAEEEEEKEKQQQVTQACRQLLLLTSRLESRLSMSGIQFRFGAHVGPLMSSVLGLSVCAFDIMGQSVNLASRACSATGAIGRVCVTSSFVDEVTKTCIEDDVMPRVGSLRKSSSSLAVQQQCVAVSRVSTFAAFARTNQISLSETEHTVEAKGVSGGVRVRLVSSSGSPIVTEEDHVVSA